MASYLRDRGYRISFDLNSRVDCIILADPRVGGFVHFGLDQVRAYKSRFPGTPCIQRINDSDLARGTSHLDTLLAKVNQVADFTVFISEWLLDYHAAIWFDKSAPHSVILNGANPAVFHPIGSDTFAPGKPFRLVTHHWSDNWMKGFAVYEDVDRLIAGGHLPEMEFHVIGRWPKQIRWQAAQTHGPINGSGLACLLRQCHVYITGSQYEGGGMHHIEGAQCGLPVLYSESGGGVVELAQRYGIGFQHDVRSAILEARAHYSELRRKVLQSAPSGDQMCAEYIRVIQRLIVES